MLFKIDDNALKFIVGIAIYIVQINNNSSVCYNVPKKHITHTEKLIINFKQSNLWYYIYIQLNNNISIYE